MTQARRWRCVWFIRHWPLIGRNFVAGWPSWKSSCVGENAWPRLSGSGRQDRPRDLLADGEALSEGRRWRRERPDELTDVERRYLEASDAQEARGARERTSALARQRLYVAVSLIALALLLGAGTMTLRVFRDEPYAVNR